MQAPHVKICVFLTAFLIGISVTVTVTTAEGYGHEVVPIVAISDESNLDATDEDQTFELPPDLYSPTPNGIYFPEDDKAFERDTALIMNISEEFRDGSIKIKDDFIESDLSVSETGKVWLRTRKFKGAVYEFKGQFLKDGFKKDFSDGETVLTGTLFKRKNGKIVYSISSKYSFVAEVCAWNENNR